MMFKSCPTEFKFGDAGTFEGYASRFGNVDLGNDVVMPGAFKEFALTRAGKVKILNQHGQRDPIGLADVRQDSQGLEFKGALVLGVPSARTVYEQMKGGLIEETSIGYDVLPGGAKVRDDGVRELRALKLWEISVVTFPMNPLATIDAVKAIGEIKTIRELEDHLRDAGGFSRNEAKALAFGGFKALQDLRDAGNESDSSQAAVALVQQLIRISGLNGANAN